MPDCQKRPYPTRGAAVFAAVKIYETDPTRVLRSVYYCGSCRAFHLSRLPARAGSTFSTGVGLDAPLRSV